ncbi:UNVERIFIED_CONTAM: hypothetical protein Sradi_3044800 [Sesamum radiatum]|uniref:F-box domain-containing protein n=1 Tax=Sesamum radiatum TaxID=300843 RepID=A0AAW2RCB9_SESRA
MDALLCDELLQEIFHRIPPPSSAVVSLVSKRWRRLLRTSTTSLSLHYPPPYGPTTIASFSAFLTHHPLLSSLSIAGPGGEDPLLLAVASSCPNLRHLRFSCSPVSAFSLYTLSTSCIHLSSISVTISRPLSFRWLPCFNSLKRLSLFLTNPSSEINNHQVKEMEDAVLDVEMNLESLSLCGILAGDHGLSFLWRNCKNVKKLQLKSCESIGDYSSFSRFLKCLNGLQELELRSCRSIIDVVLLNLADNCVSLDSLLIYDGGSREGLLQFINQSKCSLRRLDLRLPLDLDNSHLIALSENLNFRGLALGRAVASSLEELDLINCDVVEREPGLLTTLGQSLKKLRKLDLSYNDMLLDKELVSMLVSCNCLVELKLRGCGRLTNATLGSMIRSRNQLQHIDITHCCGIEVGGVEFFVLNAQRLRRVEVEQSKLSEVARRWASNKFMEVVC